MPNNTNTVPARQQRMFSQWAAGRRQRQIEERRVSDWRDAYDPSGEDIRKGKRGRVR